MMEVKVEQEHIIAIGILEPGDMFTLLGQSASLSPDRYLRLGGPTAKTNDCPYALVKSEANAEKKVGKLFWVRYCVPDMFVVLIAKSADLVLTRKEEH